MADWLSFGAACVAIVISMVATIVAIQARRESRRQADAAEGEVHAIRTPIFDAELLPIHGSADSQLALRLALTTQWAVTQVRVEILDEDGVWFEPGSGDSPPSVSREGKTAELGCRKIQSGEQLKLTLAVDSANYAGPIRFRLITYPDVPADASEITKAPWAQALELPRPPALESFVRLPRRTPRTQ
ncbi:hypothetical protein J4573_16255 [Actinomadura barringtoniae]|uniref:Uncharacterized protein n=1 Tax=Actinomadura barringtoniae TaxID=1427535 RepID=A0A939P9Y2_9ACTN|nr:hypothetical protein [Actinomadura barringtoniae]MBO2448655.1 hypothetical protein [Actinomadura barringtoniae]